MDEIEQRLKDTSSECLSAYARWVHDQRDGKAREDLMEAVHELRKVASRLEIELAISEREEMSQKHIPIPPHRASRPRNRSEEMRDFSSRTQPSVPAESASSSPKPSFSDTEDAGTKPLSLSGNEDQKPGVQRVLRRRRIQQTGPETGE